MGRFVRFCCDSLPCISFLDDEINILLETHLVTLEWSDTQIIGMVGQALVLTVVEPGNGMGWLWVALLLTAVVLPADLLRMFFDTLYDEDVVKEDAFYSWESSKDPAEQQGKGVALKSVTAFFKWLREAEEEESDHN